MVPKAIVFYYNKIYVYWQILQLANCSGTQINWEGHTRQVAAMTWIPRDDTDDSQANISNFKMRHGYLLLCWIRHITLRLGLLCLQQFVSKARRIDRTD